MENLEDITDANINAIYIAIMHLVKKPIKMDKHNNNYNIGYDL